MPSLRHIDLLEGTRVKFGYRFAFIHHWLSGPSFAQVEKALKLNEAECAVIFTTAQAAGLTATDICEVTGRSKNSISRAVHRTLARKLVVRKRTARDRRQAILELTEAGWKAYSIMAKIFLTRERDMLSILTTEELATLDGIMKKLVIKVGDWAKTY
jgi:MarR family transcriptional regulator, temperature-dependent positive regulator of motility